MIQSRQMPLQACQQQRHQLLMLSMACPSLLLTSERPTAGGATAIRCALPLLTSHLLRMAEVASRGVFNGDELHSREEERLADLAAGAEGAETPPRGLAERAADLRKCCLPFRTPQQVLSVPCRYLYRTAALLLAVRKDPPAMHCGCQGSMSRILHLRTQPMTSSLPDPASGTF